MDHDFRPLPYWPCLHSWHQVGPAFVTWTSAGVNTPAPPYAPRFAECRCANCGGYEILPDSADEQR
jgi:hypothetical protein